MTVRVAYVHNVCMHYKLPLLCRLAAMDNIELHGVFGHSHWKRSKFQSVPHVDAFSYRILPTIDFWLPFKGRGMHLFWNPTLGRTLRRIRPDVIIAGNSNFPNNLAVMRYARRFGIPYIWHGIGSMYSKPTVYRRLASRSMNRFFSGASFGLAFNSVSKQYYAKQHGVPMERIAVAPNLVDTDAVTADRNRFASQVSDVREQLGLTAKKVVLFVGVIGPAKKLDRLIDAFAQIHTAVPDSVLLIVGDGIALADAERRVSERDLGEHVVFAGKHVVDANLYYMLGDLFVLPGLGGLAVSQAMAHGMPVISAPADGTERDLITDGENGYLLNIGEGEDPVFEIAELVTRLLTDDELRTRMGRASRKFIEERFNINRSAEVFRNAIVTVTGEATESVR